MKLIVFNNLRYKLKLKINMAWYSDDKIPFYINNKHPYFLLSREVFDNEAYFWEIPIDKMTENWSTFCFGEYDDNCKKERKVGTLRYRLINNVVEVELFPYSKQLETQFSPTEIMCYYSALSIMTDNEFKEQHFYESMNLKQYSTIKTHLYTRIIDEKTYHIIIGAYIIHKNIVHDKDKYFDKLYKNEKIIEDKKDVKEGDTNMLTSGKNNGVIFNRAYDAISNDEKDKKI